MTTTISKSRATPCEMYKRLGRGRPAPAIRSARIGKRVDMFNGKRLLAGLSLGIALFTWSQLALGQPATNPTYEDLVRQIKELSVQVEALKADVALLKRVVAVQTDADITGAHLMQVAVNRFARTARA